MNDRKRGQAVLAWTVMAMVLGWLVGHVTGSALAGGSALLLTGALGGYFTSS